MVDAKAVRSESRRSAGGDCNWRGAVKSKQLMAEQQSEGERAEGESRWRRFEIK